MRIRTEFYIPPIPYRIGQHFQYSAVDVDTYDIGEPIGFGRTEEEAVADLREQIEERDHEH